MKYQINNTSVNGFEDATDVMMAGFEEEDDIEVTFAGDLDATNENCCTYTKFLQRPPAKRPRLTLSEPQALYLCLTCCPDVRKVLEQCAQVCSACSYHCHENHELVEWNTKRNLVCDCPTERIPKSKCTLITDNLSNGRKTPKKAKILNSTRKRPHPDSEPDPEPDNVFEHVQDTSVVAEIKQQDPNIFPHHLIGLMYRLDLSVLCLLRKLRYESTYPSLVVEFDNHEFERFNNIIFRHKSKSIHLQIEHTDKYKNNLSYTGLFSKDKRSFSIHHYFDSFVRYLLKSGSSAANDIEYLVIYTNSSLELTVDNKFQQRRIKNFYPFQFESKNQMEDLGILKEFFLTNDSVIGREFYQLSSDKCTREELLQRLDLSSALVKDAEEQCLSQVELKNLFLDRLVFAVNQPSRQELNIIVKKEIETYGNGQVNYGALQKDVLHHVANANEVLYEFNLLTALLNQMFLYKKIISIHSERKAQDIYNDITIRYKKNKFIYVKAISPSSGKLGYSQLFTKRKGKYTLRELFSLFIEKSNKNLQFFIIYTDADLNLTKRMTFKRISKSSDPLKFVQINIQEKEYKLIRKATHLNENCIYKFSNKRSTRADLFEQLKLPNDLQKEKEDGKLSAKDEKALKNDFLDKLIFAVNQPNNKKLKKLIKKEIKSYTVPYNCEELNEIALRWSESHELGPISTEIIENLLDDIQNHRLSQKKNQRFIFEEIKFAKSVAGKEGTLAYDQLLDLLVKDDIINILKSKGVNPANLSNIISRAGAVAMKAFNEMYGLWFDEEGNKSKYLINLEEKGINLGNVSSILNGSRSSGAENFRILYELWFDEKGNKTRYLTNLEAEGINLGHMANILGGSGIGVTKAFKELCGIWFDEQGNKTQYLKSFEKEGINLVTVSSFLNGARVNAAAAFKDLYDIWFDKSGNKAPCLKLLQEEGIDLCTASSMVSGGKGNAAKAFSDLYALLFDHEGNKTQYLQTLGDNGVNLINVSSILNGAGSNAAKAFKDLYDLWFDAIGNKTNYLKSLEAKEINLDSISSILHGAGSTAAKAFKELYDLWFDEEGNTTQYLETLEEKGISLKTISNTLNGVGANAGKAFKELNNTLIDDKSSKIEYLKALEENGVCLSSVCTILSGAGTKAPKAFQDLYDLWFDVEGNKTHYLKALEEQGIDLRNISNILSGAGAKAPKAFKDLYNTFFNDKEGKTDFLKMLEQNKLDLNNVSSILHGSGADISKAFKELYSTFVDEEGNINQHLEHFIEKKDGEKSFKLHNLSGILNKTGAQAKDAFERLHDVCFENDGERTKLIQDFYRAGFKSSNIATLLNGTGIRAAFTLKRFHNICFYENGSQKDVLKDFTNAGFTMGHLCSLLSGTPNTIELLHDFCFVRETKKYLNHFLNEPDGFTPSCLTKILQASGTDVCFVLKEFHDVCFYEAGSRTQLIEDFYSSGFRARDLANILSMTGSRAAFLLNSFHDLCFGYKNCLNHFLAEEEVFSPKKLSQILCGTSFNVCYSFERLHCLCFDKEGNKTKYLKKIIKNNTLTDVLNILQEKARATSYSFLDDISFQEEKIKKELIENW